MKVTVRLFAMLRSRLPPGSDAGEAQLDVEPGTTARQIIEQLQIPQGMAHLVMVNGRHLLPAQILEDPLQPGDALAIFPPIAGG